MPHPRPHRSTRHLAVAAALAATGSLVAGTPAAVAQVVPTTIEPSTTAPATTSAPTTAATSTTTAPPATQPPVTPVPPSTSPGTAPATTGVPNVPTGGGAPTTTAPPGAPTTTPAPVDVGPAIDAVDADLDQLAAISNYATAQQAVPAAQAQVAAANATLAAAQSRRDGTKAGVATATGRMAAARDAMARLALAAYTGEAYTVPGSGQQASANGTVHAPASGQAAASDPEIEQEAGVLLGVVVQHTKRSYDDAASALRDAQHVDDAAAGEVATAGQTLAAAQAAVGSAQAALLADVQAATQPGVALAQQTSAQLASAASGRGRTATTAATSPPPIVISGGPTVLGPSVLTAPELAAWFVSTGRHANATVTMAELANDYLVAGNQTGVRADMAFAQSVIETGYFDFPAGGQLTGADNNFAGIGACDSCAHGWSFPDALTGVSAQMQLLEAYASPTPVATPLIGKVGVGGCCATWTALAGTWASNEQYGLEILTMYKAMLDWVIPQRLLAVGLPAPAGTTPAPPGTEPTGPSAPQPGVPGPGAAPLAPAPATTPASTAPPPAGPTTTAPKHP